MFSKVKGLAIAATLFLVGLVAPATAMAATPVNVTSVVSAVEAALIPIGLIGLAVLALLVGIKTYKWIRRAM